MKPNLDLIITAVLLALVLALVVALELLGKPVPGLLATAGTVLLGSVSALARGAYSAAVTPASSTPSSVADLPSDVPVLEGPR